MAEVKKNSIFQLIFLELLSLSPVFIILGNIIPPMPIKLHHIGLGLVFLLAGLLLLKDGYKKWLIYFSVFFVLIQLTFENWYIKGMIDYFFGPFVLVVMLDILVNNRLQKDTMQKYLKRFVMLLWISPLIAVLQYCSIIPITFLNATYINYAYVGDVAIPRPNGFLYHGAELSVIICFLALFQFFKKESRSFWLLLLLTLIALMTYFKALLACIALLFIYYLVIVNKGPLSRYKLISKKKIIYISAFLFLAIIGVGVWFFTKFYMLTGQVFPKDMLTGRGAIWNIYLERIKDFTWVNYLFGNGLGSSFDVFTDYATKDNWWRLAVDPNTDLDYDTHNSVLSIFINSGIVGICFIVFLFRMVYRQVIKWLPNEATNKELFFGIFIIPLVTIGVTIPIYENAIFWIALSFVIWNWKFESDAQ